jgi:gamma-glutamyl-gamma-aminobutyrate hydrolase PuuD
VNYFKEKITVNSYHSLAIAEPQVSARRLVTSDDGSCESWIDGTLAAVVWHPERMSTPWLPAEINLLLKV